EGELTRLVDGPHRAAAEPLDELVAGDLLLALELVLLAPEDLELLLLDRALLVEDLTEGPGLQPQLEHLRAHRSRLLDALRRRHAEVEDPLGFLIDVLAHRSSLRVDSV